MAVMLGSSLNDGVLGSLELMCDRVRTNGSESMLFVLPIVASFDGFAVSSYAPSCCDSIRSSASSSACSFLTLAGRKAEQQCESWLGAVVIAERCQSGAQLDILVPANGPSSGRLGVIGLAAHRALAGLRASLDCASRGQRSLDQNLHIVRLILSGLLYTLGAYDRRSILMRHAHINHSIAELYREVSSDKDLPYEPQPSPDLGNGNIVYFGQVPLVVSFRP